MQHHKPISMIYSISILVMHVLIRLPVCGSPHALPRAHLTPRPKATFANLLALLGETRDDGGVHHLQHNLVIMGSVGEETGRLGASALKAWLQQRNIVLEDLSMCLDDRSPVLNPARSEIE